MSKKQYFILILGAIIAGGLLWNYRLSLILKKDGVITTGKILKLSHSRRADYFLEYQYHVGDSIYSNEMATSYFECDDGSRGCEGKEVRVIYSEGNPEVSDVDLGPNNNKKGRRLYY
ncbi:hypothetical protein [Flagellimonas sp. C4]|uniref:hypothetical protein n=1 Tax=Flagellimonas alginolytica TaxID=3177515 RepID=UPI0035C8BC9D